MLINDIEEVLITQEQIHEKTVELGKILAAEYQDKNPLVIGILKGAVPFMADIIRACDMQMEMDFMDVSSYGRETHSSGEVKILKDLDTNVAGRDVLIVEDIIDTGLTLSYLVDLFKYRQAKSVKIVTLLDKPSGRTKAIEADYVGFSVPGEFVVGYGLDYLEQYRNLPFVGILKPAIYEKDAN
ncbi:hypoxanthine phosphoribosyltransferase [Enterococcus timonensis]|uniref:hypoxanthine phosphoribosyltransferase n=1 Tax=Enterococcus timonensis TaxID=1852364 RepID=UPI0008DAE445|nr:hypoxanthine phosphoribosyltransferase [Enterococcus timonensis]